MRVLVVAILLFYLSACKESSPSKSIDRYSKYELLAFGEGTHPRKGEVIFTTITILNEQGDTIHYVPNYAYHFTIKNAYLDKVWQKFKVGDRVQLTTQKHKVVNYLPFVKLQQDSSSTLVVDFTIKESLSPLKAKELIQEELSRRELEEVQELANFIKDSEDSFEFKNGIYKKVEIENNGEPIKFGSKVSIDYTGEFLNGFVFDNTKEKGITPSFTYGQEYQLLEGIKTALSGVKEGERIKIILPSRHAFGENGSLAGIVPPYTAVLYKVNVIKVIN